MRIGNTYELIENPRPSRDKSKVNKHRWSMFVQVNNDCIRSVTYTLDETFTPSTVTVTKPPFLLTRLGYEAFGVGVRINYKKGVSGVGEVLHELDFSKESTHQSYELLIAPAKQVFK
jgi:transcription initiation factor IIF auxiliary subunit